MIHTGYSRNLSFIKMAQTKMSDLTCFVNQMSFGISCDALNIDFYWNSRYYTYSYHIIIQLGESGYFFKHCLNKIPTVIFNLCSVYRHYKRYSPRFICSLGKGSKRHNWSLDIESALHLTTRETFTLLKLSPTLILSLIF